MINVINFPKSNKRPSPLPKQRVFYIGYRYVGPMFCQEVQQLYLKRKGLKAGQRYWAIITYGKYSEWDAQKYSIELAECRDECLLEMLEKFEIRDEVTIADLNKMGWRGLGDEEAEVIALSRNGDLYEPAKPE